MIRLPLTASALVFLVSIAACSSPDETSETRMTRKDSETFSAEDRRVAKALSLGGYELRASGNTYDKAVLCNVSLQALADRMRESGLLSAEQQRAFSQAQGVYTLRAGSTGKSASQIAQDRREVEAAYPDMNARARIAIGCLRELV